ncbi:MAG: O-phosphoseryl-tRNA(Sec) selenium transferase [Candidatus Hodarchaeota archaeon]
MLKDLLREKLKDLMEKGILERGLMILDDQLKPIKQLLEQRTIPTNGWKEDQVRLLFQLLASMDTDKDENAARVGEREGRTASSLVSELCAGFSHGIGRGGDIFAIQPKATGGSILNLLSSKIATSLLKSIGMSGIKSSIVLPVATGMSLGLCLSRIHQDWIKETPENQWLKDEIVMPRLDHKSPIKGIRLAGFKLHQVESELNGDSVRVNVERIQESITPKTAAVVSTTAFFPPRAPDDIKEIAKMCKDLQLPHVINNSYGVQSSHYLKLIRGSIDAGRVDYIMQSTDKNFLTPVGGAVVCSPSEEKIGELSKVYAGRASASPLVQFLAAALALGTDGYKKLMEGQVENRKLLEQSVGEFAREKDQRLLEVDNPIAIAMTLNGIPKKIGGILYNLRVTGPRVLFPGDFGTCIDDYPVPYMTLNAGLGARREDFENLVNKLVKAFSQL